MGERVRIGDRALLRTTQRIDGMPVVTSVVVVALLSERAATVRPDPWPLVQPPRERRCAIADLTPIPQDTPLCGACCLPRWERLDGCGCGPEAAAAGEEGR